MMPRISLVVQLITTISTWLEIEIPDSQEGWEHQVASQNKISLSKMLLVGVLWVG